MEKSKIKKIGNSWYIRIPPCIHKNIQLYDNEEIFIDHLGKRLEIRFEFDTGSNDAALHDLNEGISLGPPKILVREELYETDRY
ncbi:MAG TPA: hypothetical protein VMV49_08550 [Candidatus Deferrimicrobium sp.]|nr:hypothetical protein [Candidatus Deferrimicrobium sp.]